MQTLPEEISEQLVRSIFSSSDLRRVLIRTAECLGEGLAVSRVVIVPRFTEEGVRVPPIEWSAFQTDSKLDNVSLRLAQYFSKCAFEADGPILGYAGREDVLLTPVQSEAELFNIQSVLLLGVEVEEVPKVSILLYQTETPRLWGSEEIECLEKAGDYLEAALRPLLVIEQLRAREAQGRDFLGNELTGSMHFDSQGKILGLNKVLERITGFSGAELKGQTFQEYLDLLVVPEERASVQEIFRRAFREGTQELVQYKIRNGKNDEILLLEQVLSPRIRKSGNIDGFESAVFDVSGVRNSGQGGRRGTQYQRLVEHSDALIFHCDPTQAISFISSRVIDFLGIPPEELSSEPPVYWYELAHPEERQRVRVTANKMLKAREAFDEEFRVENQATGKVRWLLVRLVPVLAEKGRLEGWDGFGVDITERREAQEALDAQSKKIRALYTVSSAIRGYIEPGNIAARGLSSLCDATGADAGVCFLCEPGKTDELHLVSECGFSEGFTARAEAFSNLPNLSSYVAKHGQSIVVPDIRNDPRANRVLAEEEGLRSAVLVPVCVENDNLGTLGLFSRQTSRFDAGDVMLVSAAANQIGLASRQASLFTAHRKQTKKLEALYRASHELSQNLSLDEIFEKAFQIIQDELGIERVWLGLLDETGTRINGQAAHGPGLRKQLAEIDVEVRGREHPFARVIEEKEPIIIDEAEEVFRELGERKIFTRIGLHSIALVPMISGGQVLGVLAVQPDINEPELTKDEITLLGSLANEVAIVLFTKRLEERIAESQKMQTAGLLAAGIAHNFNNILQGILGQASLLEMQGTDSDRVKRSAQIINDAATKGAGLVRQLVRFAHLEEPDKTLCDVNALIERNRENLFRLLKGKQKIVLQMGEEVRRAFVDSSQLVRVISDLVSNAAQATGEGGEIRIFTDDFTLKSTSAEYEVPPGEYVRIGVEDSGHGMDEETRRRCFEPFFTTKDVDPGSGLGISGNGLGLAAAYAIIRRNGGRLLVESKVGKGSLFTVLIPIARGAPLGVEKQMETTEFGDVPIEASNAFEPQEQKIEKMKMDLEETRPVSKTPFRVIKNPRVKSTRPKQ